MFPVILLPVVFSAIAQASNFYPSIDVRVNAPLMGGWVDYNHFDTRSDTDSNWVPMNTTGSAASGNLYLPFYDFTDEINGKATTQAGYRLDGDETSEVLFVHNDDYISPSMNVTVGHIKSAGTDIYTETQLTYLPAAAAVSRDLWSNGTLVDLPFTSQTAFIGKEMIDNGTKNLVTADGTTTFFSAIDNLSVPVPPNTTSTITLRNGFDPGFSAVLTFGDASPFLFSKGSSARIGPIALNQEVSIVFCPEDD
ncbi:hypothetical protein B0H12DRAFT_1224764 [Mycena haematopus]|nr:hypothetical protein B0H12DRAFT_1224764 [Mycena haematopus]